MAKYAKHQVAGLTVNTGNNSVSAVQKSPGYGSDPMLPPGTNFCRCGACGRYFGGVNGFERHRVGFHCVDPVAVGLVLSNRGYWVRNPPRIGPIQGGAAKLDDFSAKTAVNLTGGES